jgi:amidase
VTQHLDDVLAKSAVDIAALIAGGDVSSEQVTLACLDRIDHANPELNAFVTYGRRRALFAARACDRKRRKLDRLPPFFGVPTGIKDMNLVREFATRFGSAAVRMPYIPVDDRLTGRMREAGFVIVGKLATSEAGALPIVEPRSHPPTLTPWRSAGARSAGGSSGGSGSAVAAGLLPIAPGTDGAGSIRIPASFNGLVGLKPSRGRIGNAYGLKDKHVLYTDGPIARSVLDAAHLFDAMAGITVGKPALGPPPATTFAAATHVTTPPLHIRVSYHHGLATTEPDVVEAVRRVARLLEAAGHHIDESPWISMDLDDFLPVWQRSVAKARLILKRHGVEPATAWLRGQGEKISQAQADTARDMLETKILSWFGEADLWLSPTVCGVAPKIGLGSGTDGEAVFRRTAPLGGFTAPFNVTGQPAISIPVGCDHQGLPIGVQLAARRYHESTLLSVAAALERQLPAITTAASHPLR